METRVKTTADFLIIGAGIIGLNVARTLHAQHPSASIIVIDKESDVAQHASGRNSGVLHAGFYYSPNSLKAQFCRDGNTAMRAFVRENKLRINDCGKVVVARNEMELPELERLYERGKENGVKLQLVDEKELVEIEPNAKTTGKAIYSPTTAIIDPIEVCQTMRKELQSQGIQVLTNTPYEHRIGGNTIVAGGKTFEAGRIINCAGLYADRIAKDFGFCEQYSIVPFKGVYREYTGADKPISKCVYGVPNPHNPFLGVHYSVTVDGRVKIGPTAIPIPGRENYHGMEGVNIHDALQIMKCDAVMFATDPDFRSHAFREIRKYYGPYMISQAAQMVKHLDKDKFTSWGRPGIRAQLMDDQSYKLLHDFKVEGDNESTHVLNAVSPAFTSSIPFAKYIVENYIEKTPPSPVLSEAFLHSQKGKHRG